MKTTKLLRLRIIRKIKANKIDSIFIFCLILISLIFSILFFESRLGTKVDNGHYIVLAKSILQGKYHYISSPIYEPHTKYPFVFPLLLALLQFISPNNYVLMKIMVMLFGVGSGVVFYFICQSKFSKFISFLFSIVLIVNSFFVEFSHHIMTEIPYIFFTLLVLYFYIHQNYQIKTFKDKNFLLIIIFSIITFHLRTAYIAMLMGISACYLIDFTMKKEKEKLRRLIFFVLSMVIFLSPWQIRNKIVGGTSSDYIFELTTDQPAKPDSPKINLELAKLRVKNNLRIYGYQKLPALFSMEFKKDRKKMKNRWDDRTIKSVPIILFLLILGGMIYCLIFVRYRLIFWYMVFYILMAISWPDTFLNIRLIIPLIPFFLISIFFILSSVPLKYKVNKIIYVLVSIVLIILNVNGLKELKRRVDNYPKRWDKCRQTAFWVKNNLPEDVILTSTLPTLYYLWSERSVVPYTISNDKKEMMEDIRKKNVDYVIYDRLKQLVQFEYLDEMVNKYKSCFEPAYHTEIPSASVLKFNKNCDININNRRRKNGRKSRWEKRND